MESEGEDQIASPDEDSGSLEASFAGDGNSSEEESEGDSSPSLGEPLDKQETLILMEDPESLAYPGSRDELEGSEEIPIAYQHGPHTPSDMDGEPVETPASPSNNSAESSSDEEDDLDDNSVGEMNGNVGNPVERNAGDGLFRSSAASEDNEEENENGVEEPEEDMEWIAYGDESGRQEGEAEDYESLGEMQDDVREDDDITKGEEGSDENDKESLGVTLSEDMERTDFQRTIASPEVDSPAVGNAECLEVDNSSNREYEQPELDVAADQAVEEQLSMQETDPTFHRLPSPDEVSASNSQSSVVELAEQTQAVSLDQEVVQAGDEEETSQPIDQDLSSDDDAQSRVDQNVGEEGEAQEPPSTFPETSDTDKQIIAPAASSGRHNINAAQVDLDLEDKNDQKISSHPHGSSRETGRSETLDVEASLQTKSSITHVTRSEQYESHTTASSGEGSMQKVSGITDQSAVADQSKVESDQSENAAATGANQSEVLDVHHLDDHGVELDYEEDVEDHEKMGKDGKEDGEEGIDAEEGEEDDDGELEDDEDMEEGEVKEPGSRKPFVKKVCRFYREGKCTWGSNCRFVHPGVNDKGNYSMIDRRELHEATAKLLGIPQAPAAPAPPRAFSPPPPPPSEPVGESAWERGLRHAKEIRKKAMLRKEQDHNFEEKRMLGGIPYEEERDYDKENDFTLPQGNANYEEFYGFSLVDEEAPPTDNREALYQQPYEVYNAQYQRREPPQQYDYRRSGKDRQWQEEREEMERRDMVRQRQREMNRQRERPREVMRDRRTPPRPLSRERPLPGNTRPIREDVDRPLRGEERRRKEVGPHPGGHGSSRPADAWQDPWARSRSPKANAKAVGRRRRSYSYSSDSFSDSSFSSRSRSRSRSSYSSSSRSSSGSSFSRSSFSHSRSYSRSRSPSPRSRARAGQAGRARPGYEKAGSPGFPRGRSSHQQQQQRQQQPLGKAGLVGGLGRGATSGPGRGTAAVPQGNRGAASNKPTSVRGPTRSPIQQKRPTAVASSDKKAVGNRRSPDLRRMPPGRQIRPRPRSSSSSSFSSHSSYSSRSGSRSRSRSVSSVSSYSSISSSESDMSPHRPAAIKGIDGKRLPPNTKLPKVGIPALQARSSKVPPAPTNRNTKPPPITPPKTPKAPPSSKAPLATKAPPSKPPPNKGASSSKPSAGNSKPAGKLAPPKPAPPKPAQPKPAQPKQAQPKLAPLKPPSSSKRSPSRSSKSQQPSSKTMQAPAKTTAPTQAKQKTTPKPAASSREKDKEKTRTSSSSGTTPSASSGSSSTATAAQRQHSTSVPVAAAPRSNTLKVTAHKDIKLTLLSKPSADPKKRSSDPQPNQAGKKTLAGPAQSKTSADKERKTTRPPSASPTATKKTVPSADANRKTGAQSHASKTTPKPASGDRKRPSSPGTLKGQPPAKVPARTAHAVTMGGSAKAPTAAPGAGKPAGAAKASGSAAPKKSTTVSRREELLKQLRAVEDAIARKKAKLK
ncbi:zinc finger CCCH domain-containing protein 18-like isoform X2 [Acanthaster planci]|uniref:Zinc finger CCCH domain-containing protein 18-like isoform X2 n=1 Tax=Acanthaster planci TaxID=133434 RepID=A0A8B7ZCM0_ACAPL|nr:zinc finger CCCH domain-containing protein 18-like isoform X2 [Acanthaster planci]